MGTYHEPEMIPLSSAGVQSRDQPLRAVNNGSGHLENPQVLPQSDVNPERLPMSVPQTQFRQPAVIDLTAAGAGGGGEVPEKEPPTKRQRLDTFSGMPSGAASPAPSVGGGDSKSVPGGLITPRPPSTSWRGKPAWSFQSLISETPGVGDVYGENAAALAQGGKPASPPPLPSLPWRYAPRESSRGSRSRESSPPKEVQMTPYRLDTPSVAPTIKGESEYIPLQYRHKRKSS